MWRDIENQLNLCTYPEQDSQNPIVLGAGVRNQALGHFFLKQNVKRSENVTVLLKREKEPTRYIVRQVCHHSQFSYSSGKRTEIIFQSIRVYQVHVWGISKLFLQDSKEPRINLESADLGTSVDKSFGQHTQTRPNFNHSFAGCNSGCLHDFVQIERIHEEVLPEPFFGRQSVPFEDLSYFRLVGHAEWITLFSEKLCKVGHPSW